MPHATYAFTTHLAKSIQSAMRNDSRTARITFPSRRVVFPSDTDGHSVIVAKVGRRLSVELWVDLYAGSGRPAVWIGFFSFDQSEIRRLISAAEATSFGRPRILRTARDVAKKGRFWQFTHPLSRREFDVQVLERYPECCFLGIYMAYQWPLNGQSERAAVRDSVNYVGTLVDALMTVKASGEPRRVGPWNRPDREAERAAVKHVSKWLTRKGYTITSRENEICGYDLHATSGREELHVEVKGTGHSEPSFFLTRTEWQGAADDPRWRLAVVTSATTQPRLHDMISGREMRALYGLQPIQWHAIRRRATRRKS